jgi:hypothetical protein
MRELVRTSSDLIPSNVQAVWEEAEPLLAEALEGSSDTTQDILFQIGQGNALLLESYVAFAAVTRRFDPEGPVLIVWATAARGENSVTETYDDAMTTVALDLGCVAIEFWTSRKGFEKVLSKNWRPMCTLWRKELTHGGRIQ